MSLTAEDMYDMPRDGHKYELLSGSLVVNLPGMRHEEVGANLVGHLGVFADRHDIGYVFGSNIGFELSLDTVLSPDVAFVTSERFPDGVLPEGFGKFAPDLAVEIISPSDSMTMVENKVEIYLKNGTQLVWVINPKLRRATVHRADGTIAVVRSDSALDGESVLPGFTCALTEIL